MNKKVRVATQEVDGEDVLVVQVEEAEGRAVKGENGAAASAPSLGDVKWRWLVGKDDAGLEEDEGGLRYHFTD